MKLVKKALVRSLVVLIVGSVLCAAWWFCGGVSHRELKTAVQEEGVRTRAHTDVRANRIEEKLNRLEQKMDAIDGKLDRLLRLAEQPLPDAM